MGKRMCLRLDGEECTAHRTRSHYQVRTSGSRQTLMACLGQAPQSTATAEHLVLDRFCRPPTRVSPEHRPKNARLAVHLLYGQLLVAAGQHGAGKCQADRNRQV